MFQISKCPICAAPLSRKLIGRRKKFCSDRCRDQARRFRETAADAFKKGPRYPCSILPRNDERNACGTGTFEAGNHGRAPAISGPRNVIEAEVIAGFEWREVVSADGIVSFVTQLRALRRGR